MPRPSWLWHDYKRRRFNGVRLSHIQSEILVHAVMNPALHRDDLDEALYGEAEDGGPLVPLVCINVHIHRLNRKIAPWRVVIGRDRYVRMVLAAGAEMCNKMVAEQGGLGFGREWSKGIPASVATGVATDESMGAEAVCLQADA